LNETLFSEFQDPSCLPRSNLTIIKTVLVVAGDNESEFLASNPNISLFSNVYFDLLDCFINETFEAMKFQNVTLNIFLAYKSHVFEVDLTKPNNFFKGVQGKIAISPLFCAFITIAGCFAENDQVVIYLKSYNFQIYISSVLDISFIVFDALYAINDAIYCDESSLSIQTNLNCYIQNKNFSNDNQTFSGIFAVEAIYDLPIYQLPILNMNDVTFQNLWFAQFTNKTQFLDSLININKMHGNLFLNNIQIQNCFFLQGFLVFMFEDNDNTENQILNLYYDNNKLLMLNSNIILKNFTINNFNGFNFSGINNGNIENFIFFLKEWQGSIIFENMIIQDLFNVDEFLRCTIIEISSANQVFIFSNITMERIFDCNFINSSQTQFQMQQINISNATFFKNQLIYATSSSATIENLSISLVYHDFSLADNTFFTLEDNSNFSLINFSSINNQGTKISSQSSIFSIYNGTIQNITTDFLFDLQEGSFQIYQVIIQNVNLLLFFLNSLSSDLVFISQSFFTFITTPSVFLVSDVVNFSFDSTKFSNFNIDDMFPLYDDFQGSTFSDITIENFTCNSVFSLNNNANILMVHVFIQNVIGTAVPMELESNSITVINSTFIDVIGSETSYYIFDFSAWYPILINCTFINNGWKNNFSEFINNEDDNLNCVIYIAGTFNLIIQNCIFTSANVSHFSYFLITSSTTPVYFIDSLINITEKTPFFFYSGIIFQDIYDLFFYNN